MDTQEAILTEIREFRRDYTSFAIESGERLASLETQMKSLCGNGQPGRIALLEVSVEDLKEWKWRMVGISAGAGGVVSAILWIVTNIHKL